MKRTLAGTPKEPPRGGGYLQRIGMASTPATPACGSSSVPPASTPSGSINRKSSLFAKLVLREVLWGSLPAVKAAKYARTIVADGFDHPDIVKLSKLGAKGFAKNNSWRDLKRKLRKASIGPAVGNTFTK